MPSLHKKMILVSNSNIAYFKKCICIFKVESVYLNMHEFSVYVVWCIQTHMLTLPNAYVVYIKFYNLGSFMGQWSCVFLSKISYRYGF
jgi:hypothetical protein